MKVLFDTKDAFTRRPQAAKALASVQRQAAIPALLQLFKDFEGKKFPGYKEVIGVLLRLGQEGIRSLANLGKQGSMIIIEGLIEIWRSDYSFDRYNPWREEEEKAAKETLRSIGEPMIEPLWEAIRSEGSFALTLGLIDILEEHFNDRSFDILLQIITGKDWFASSRAASVLLQWYKAGRLTDAQKTALLKHREKITTRHEDHKNVHTDFAASQYHLDRDCFTGAHVDSPPHGHQDTTNPHSDNGGMGLEFPL